MPGMQAILRLTILLTAAAFAVASSSSSSNAPPPAMAAGTSPPPQAPASQPMDPSMAMGLWNSNFGAVKVEADNSSGTGRLMGIWLYDRDGQEIIGFFSGTAQGNVLQFSWQEPSTGAPLQGAGYLVFDPAGKSFTGRWWTNNRDRGGDWNGWRGQPAADPVPDAPAPVSAEFSTSPFPPSGNDASSSPFPPSAYNVYASPFPPEDERNPESPFPPEDEQDSESPFPAHGDND